MNKRLTRSPIRAELASPTYLGLEIIEIIILPCINAWHAPSTRETCMPCQFVFRNYFKNYFAMYKRLTRTRIRVERASHAYSGLGIIWIIILPCINAWRAPVYAWNSQPPPSWG